MKSAETHSRVRSPWAALFVLGVTASVFAGGASLLEEPVGSGEVADDVYMTEVLSPNFRKSRQTFQSTAT